MGDEKQPHSRLTEFPPSVVIVRSVRECRGWEDAVATREQGLRRTGPITAGIAALAAAGVIGFGVLAQEHSTAAGEDKATAATDSSTGTGFTTTGSGTTSSDTTSTGTTSTGTSSSSDTTASSSTTDSNGLLTGTTSDLSGTHATTGGS